MTPSFLRTLKLKVRGEAYRWLDAAATEVRSLGWIPFKAANIKRKGRAVRGDWHDRDVNAARNMVGFGSRCWTSVRGNELSQEQHPVQPDIFVRATDGRVIAHALA